MKTVLSIQFNDNKYYLTLLKAKSNFEKDYYRCKFGFYKLIYRLPSFNNSNSFTDFGDLYFNKVFKKRKKYPISQVGIEIPVQGFRPTDQEIMEEAIENQNKLRQIEKENFAKMWAIAEANG
jgi:hypothetical protein